MLARARARGVFFLDDEAGMSYFFRRGGGGGEGGFGQFVHV